MSPDDQRERIDSICTRDGMALLDVFDELDVSDGAPLAQRHGLKPPVEMIERGEVA